MVAGDRSFGTTASLAMRIWAALWGGPDTLFFSNQTLFGVTSPEPTSSTPTPDPASQCGRGRLSAERGPGRRGR
jgi:hypothetical protein